MEARKTLAFRKIETLKLLAEKVDFRCGASATLLDLGCADRFLAPACEAHGWGYLGLDYADIDFEFEKFPIEENSIDIAISLAVIEYLRNPDTFVSEILRRLKPGGLIYLSTPNFQLAWKNFYNDPTHVRTYTLESLLEILNRYGFDCAATFPGLRCKGVHWYHGRYRFLKAHYLLPFCNDSRFPVPAALRGHARSIFDLARESMV